MLLLLLIFLGSITESQGNKHSKKLFEILLNQWGYNKLILPVNSSEGIVTVKIGLRLAQLIDLVGTHLCYDTLWYILFSFQYKHETQLQ